MSVGVYLIILSFALRFAGRYLPFSMFRERILLTRLLPVVILAILLSVHLLHSRFTLAGMYVMAQMFPEFPFLLVLGVAYLLVVSYRILRRAALTYRFRRELLSSARKEGDLYVLPIKKLVALNVGFFRPKVVVSEGVLALPEREREMVLDHERYHVRMRDNLRLLLFEILLPTERDREDYRAYLEIRNDARMLGRYAPLEIARTLLKFSMAYPTATGMATSLKRRIGFLAGEERLLDLKPVRVVALLLLPLIWYLAYTSCYMDLCTK